MAKTKKKMSAALKAFLKRHGRFPRKGELSRGRASPGGARTKKTRGRRSSASSRRSSGRSSGGRSMARRESIPLIGIRGSANAVSIPKAAVVGGAAILADTANLGQGYTPIEIALGKPSAKYGSGPLGGARYLVDSVTDSLKTNPHAKLVAAVAAVGLVFGKAIDRRLHLRTWKLKW